MVKVVITAASNVEDLEKGMIRDKWGTVLAVRHIDILIFTPDGRLVLVFRQCDC